MQPLKHHPLAELGDGFLPPEFLPEGKDEFHLRNAQQLAERVYRPLETGEIEILTRNGNQAYDWSRILVGEVFDPALVSNCRFHGLVRIGNLESGILEHHDLRLPVGLYNSRIVSCDIGAGAAIHNVHYLAHYIIGDEVILFNIDEMHCSNHAKFGNGILKEGEEEKVRIWIELWNEKGGRSILPFVGIQPADAALWGRFRDNAVLMRRFKEMTNAAFDHRRGYYGTVGPCTVIKHSCVIKDVAIGSDAYIKGASKLKNLTILSAPDESAQIGEGVELVNGIVGYGCHVFYGVKAVRFILGTNSNLKYGARLINSYLSDNSTISCCEVLNSLIFPNHEQHHNNSFLIASCLEGQSNMAAGATVGSNHNSRANDGEVLARRGFWPGLCTNFKHNCRFASFTLIAKGNYPAELDIRLPFSLVSNDDAKNYLLIIPAYWFLYNMYALTRNSWKFKARDKRLHARQHIEFDYLAPDTAEEMLDALALLEEAVGKAWRRARDESSDREGAPSDPENDQAKGRELLTESPETLTDLEILAEGFEGSRRKVRLLKVDAAYAAYREMLHYYAVRNLCLFLAQDPALRFADLRNVLPQPAETQWRNVGGQLIGAADLEALIGKVVNGELDSWDAIHSEYDRLWEKYPRDKAAHELRTLLAVNDATFKEITEGELWVPYLDRAAETQRRIAALTRESRGKDYENPFKRMSFESSAEQEAVMGKLDDDPLIRLIEQETLEFEKITAALKKRG